MVLHLIGLTFDVSDSVKKPEVLGITDDRPLKIPNLLEVFAFAYFPPTVIIGPQFSFQRYSRFLEKKYDGTQHFQHGFKRFLTGVCYLSVYQALTFIVPDGYFMTPEFDDKNFLYKLFLVSIWGRCTLYKYISCWILSEGAAICCGEIKLIFIAPSNRLTRMIASYLRSNVCVARREDRRGGLERVPEHQAAHFRRHLQLSRLRRLLQRADQLVGFPVRVQTSQISQQQAHQSHFGADVSRRLARLPHRLLHDVLHGVSAD